MKVSIKSTQSLLLLATITFLFIMSCNEDTLAGFLPNTELPSLYGTIKDYNTNARLDSVRITWYDDRDELGLQILYTDTLGNYSIPYIHYGVYTFHLSLNGYANQDISYELEILLPDTGFVKEAENIDDIIIDDYRREYNMFMYKLNANVKGKVYKKIDDENIADANNIVVTAKLGDINCNFGSTGITPDVYTTSTDSIGFYTLNNLPATPCVKIAIAPHSDGNNSFTYNFNDVILYSGATVLSDDITVNLDQGEVVIIHNNFSNSKMDITDDLEITFSHAMNTSDVFVSITPEIVFDLIWNDNFNVKINPIIPLQINNEYNLSITGYSTNNTPLDFNKSFITHDGMKLIWNNLEIVHDIFDYFNPSSDIKLIFSMTPDLNNNGTFVELKQNNTIIETSFSISGDTLIIDPLFTDLNAETDYNLNYLVYSTLPEYYDISEQALTFRTGKKNGIQFLWSNIYIEDGEVFNFPVESDIRILFNMVPDLSNTGTAVELKQGNIIIETSLSIDGNELVINPFNTLEYDKNYTISYTIFSSISGDYDESTLDLTTTKENLYFLWSNTEIAEGVNTEEFSVDADIMILFNMKLDINNTNTVVELRDKDEKIVAIEISTGQSENTLIINPKYALEPDQIYSISYTVFSDPDLDGDGEADIAAMSNTKVLGFKTADDNENPPEAVSGFSKYWENEESSEPTDWNTLLFDFSWNRVSYTDGYYIYAKDNKKNTDLIKVGNYLRQDYNTYQVGRVDLGDYSQFDVYEDDGIQTPFTDNTIVNFYIVAYNEYGESPLSDQIAFWDQVSPEFTVIQNGRADNTSLDNNSFSISIDNIEYCISSDSNPTFTFNENGGDTSYVLPESAIDWIWDPDLRGGSATVTVPESSNGAGDRLITTISDNSGNTSSYTDTLTPIISIESPRSWHTWEAGDYVHQIRWGIDNSGNLDEPITNVNIYFSVDGGNSWLDNYYITNITDTFYNWDIPDTLMSDAQAVIGIRDSESYNGFYWTSELFTINGLRIEDFGACTESDPCNDDTEILVELEQVGIDSVILDYWDILKHDDNEWVRIDTVITSDNYSWDASKWLTELDDDDHYYYIRVSDYDYDLRPSDITNKIYINHINTPPVADAGMDSTYSEYVNYSVYDGTPQITEITIDGRNEDYGSHSFDHEEEEVNARALTYTWSGPFDDNGDLMVDNNGDPIIILYDENDENTNYTESHITFDAPDVTENTDYTFSLIVNDGELDSESDDITITVLFDNQSPMAQANCYFATQIDSLLHLAVDGEESDYKYAEGEAVTLDGSGSIDPDDQELTYTWSGPFDVNGSLLVDNNGIPIITLSNDTDEKPTFTAPEYPAILDHTIYSFRLTVYDEEDVESEFDSEISIKILFDEDHEPIALANCFLENMLDSLLHLADEGEEWDYEYAEGEVVTLDGSGSINPYPADNNTLMYTWSGPFDNDDNLIVDNNGDPIITLSNDTDEKPTFTAPVYPSITESTDYTFSLVVNVGESISESDTVIIKVIFVVGGGGNN